jgi:hypothetical protein
MDWLFPEGRIADTEVYSSVLKSRDSTFFIIVAESWLWRKTSLMFGKR